MSITRFIAPSPIRLAVSAKILSAFRSNFRACAARAACGPSTDSPFRWRRDSLYFERRRPASRPSRVAERLDPIPPTMNRRKHSAEHLLRLGHPVTLRHLDLPHSAGLLLPGMPNPPHPARSERKHRRFVVRDTEAAPSCASSVCAAAASGLSLAVSGAESAAFRAAFVTACSSSVA
jgi:hypothetical protein